jgi:hypothetical protein
VGILSRARALPKFRPWTAGHDDSIEEEKRHEKTDFVSALMEMQVVKTKEERSAVTFCFITQAKQSGNIHVKA